MDIRDELDSPSEIAFGIILLFLPVFFIGFTLAFLQFAEVALLTELSLLELFELYVIELLLFGIATYVLYRLATNLSGEPE
jgi:hypothetical protein